MNFSKTKKMSEFFTEHEVFHSRTAEELGIDNRATNKIHVMNIGNTLGIADSIRRRWGRAIRMTSMYRSPALNKEVGGDKNSQHSVGEAFDFRDFHDESLNRDLFEMILDNYNYHQIILEFPDKDGVPDWIHLGLKFNSPMQNRISVANVVNGKTEYTHYFSKEDFRKDYPYEVGALKKKKRITKVLGFLGLIALGTILYKNI